MANKSQYGVVLQDQANFADVFKGDIIRFRKSWKGFQYTYVIEEIIIKARSSVHYTIDLTGQGYGIDKEFVAPLESADSIPALIKAIYDIP